MVPIGCYKRVEALCRGEAVEHIPVALLLFPYTKLTKRGRENQKVATREVRRRGEGCQEKHRHTMLGESILLQAKFWKELLDLLFISRLEERGKTLIDRD